MSGVGGNNPMRGRHMGQHHQDSNQFNNGLNNQYGAGQNSMNVANVLAKTEPNLQDEQNSFNAQPMHQKGPGEEMPGGPYNPLNNKMNEHLNMNPGQGNDPANMDQMNRMGHDTLNMGNVALQNPMPTQNTADTGHILGQYASQQNPELPQQNGQSRLNNYEAKNNNF